MNRLPRIAFRLLILGSLAGCATPIGMRHVDRGSIRQVLSRDTCTLAANIFDPLSARIAHMLEYEVCVLSGSVGKVANLGVPDLVLSNMSDVVDHCRRITRIADVSLMVDAEDGFGNAVNVVRTVREMEAAGVSAIEITDPDHQTV